MAVKALSPNAGGPSNGRVDRPKSAGKPVFEAARDSGVSPSGRRIPAGWESERSPSPSSALGTSSHYILCGRSRFESTANPGAFPEAQPTGEHPEAPASPGRSSGRGRGAAPNETGIHAHQGWEYIHRSNLFPQCVPKPFLSTPETKALPILAGYEPQSTLGCRAFQAGVISPLRERLNL